MNFKIDTKLKNLFIISAIISSILFACFLTLMVMVLTNYNFKIDTFFINFMQKIRTPNFTGFVKIFTHLGSVILFLALMIVLFFTLKGKKNKIFIICYFAIVCVLSVVIKYIVRRDRPMFTALIDETGFSFPSAHAMLSMAFWGFSLFLILVSKFKKPIKIIFSIIIPIVIVLVALSRVYLGVHYFTDILAGLILGAICLVLGIVAYKFILNTKQQKEEKIDEVEE